MNPIPDWVDNLLEVPGTLSVFLNDKKKFVATRTVLSFGKAGYAAMVLPVLAYAGPFDVPTIKPVPMLNDHVMLATIASTIGPVHGPSGSAIIFGSSGETSIDPPYTVVGFSKIR